MRRACWAAVAVVLGAMLGSPAVRANGRFPRAQQLIEDPADPAHLILRTTYGVLKTQNSGQDWFWICEQAIGYGGVEDPALGLTSTGTLLAGVFDGLAVSPDTGCSWSFQGGALEARYVVDLTVEKSDRSRALAMVSMGLPGGVFLNQLHRTTDGGATFSQLGPDLPDDVLGLTLDPAPSDPTRIYVSALEFAPDAGGGQGVLLRSTDDGVTFTRLPLAGTSIVESPFIAAIDPTDPQRIYVRISGPTEDYLLVSADGGVSFQELIRKNAELYGFALSPDGKTVLAGFGDPRDGTSIDPQAAGIWSASTSDYSFSRIYTEPVACLTWGATRVYACTGQFDAGFEVGASSDGGKTFSSLMQLTDLKGPLECPATSTVGSVCPAQWPTTCNTIGKCPQGTGGAAGAAGGGAGGGTAEPDADDGGCGCRAPGGRRSSSLALLLALALVLGTRKLLSGRRC